MKSVVAKIHKRRSHKVTLGTGDEINVRPLTVDETEEVIALGDNVTTLKFAVACCLLDDDGTPAIARNAGESVADFVERAREIVGPIHQDMLHEIRAGIEKASSVPKPEIIAKN